LTASEAKYVMVEQTRGPQGAALTRTVLKAMLTKEIRKSQLDMLVEETLLMPRGAAAQLMWNVQSGDFCDILPSIQVLTLCTGGSQSHLPPKSMEWASKQMQNGGFKLLNGSDFMFLEHGSPRSILQSSHRRLFEQPPCGLSSGPV
jgi:hypothetical protein